MRSIFCLSRSDVLAPYEPWGSSVPGRFLLLWYSLVYQDQDKVPCFWISDWFDLSQSKERRRLPRRKRWKKEISHKSWKDCFPWKRTKVPPRSFTSSKLSFFDPSSGNLGFRLHKAWGIYVLWPTECSNMNYIEKEGVGFSLSIQCFGARLPSALYLVTPTVTDPSSA